ncbi:MAG: hypothetical protein IMZ51_03795 [Chloroflexi bacterium]|nr:hypothetical protein [Chloroflexota bacterium]
MTKEYSDLHPNSKIINEKEVKEEIEGIDIFNGCRSILWEKMLPSFLIDVDNQRMDSYQNTKENRIIMMALLDIHNQIKELKSKLNGENIKQHGK